jgi:hypothetical protein
VHDILIHPVLEGEVDDTVDVLLREKAEEGDFESCFLSGSASDQWWELVVITDKNKLVCESQWAEAGGKGDLRSFVDDAVVEFAFGEQSAIVRRVKCLQEPTELSLALTGQSRDMSLQQLEELRAGARAVRRSWPCSLLIE